MFSTYLLYLLSIIFNSIIVVSIYVDGVCPVLLAHKT